MRNKNKQLLEIFKAQAKIRKLKKQNPEKTEEEIAEEVLGELYGPMGVQLFREVSKDPSKYKNVLKGVRTDL